MATTVRAGDTLIRIAAREGISLAALRQANPGVDPRKLRVGQRLDVPGSRDDFSRKTVKHDASAQKALRELEASGGPTISARELMRAIDKGTGDHDRNMATGEFRDFKQWAKAHESQLTDGAKQVMALYEKTAKGAVARHQTGVSDSDRAKLLHRMAQVNDGPVATPPAPTEPPAPKPDGAPDTAKEWQREAVKNPAHIFKRQVADAKWNRDPDAPSHSGHCAIASLAMAVEAYGLERKGLDKPRHVRDQDSIDDVAKRMPDKFMVKKDGGHVWYSKTSEGAKAGTYAYQMAAGAKRMGLEEKQHGSMSMKEIDRALEKGHMVCLAGEAGSKFRNAQGHTYGDGHSVLIMGKTEDGRYLVCDPLSKKGPTKLTREQLASYDTSGYTSTEVWRAKD